MEPDYHNNLTPSPGEIYNYLLGFVQEGGESWEEENRKYLYDHCLRFHETLKFIPDGNRGEKLLELGAAPYFMTLLVNKYRHYSMHLSNAMLDCGLDESSIKLSKRDTAEEYVFPYKCFNAEIDSFPYPDNTFTIVLCCELIEHLVLNPTHLLLESHRVLSSGGKLLITTPNVLVLRNFVTLLKNRRNIYAPYSSYGVYGRHNREWTLEELELLMKGCGYSIESSFIVDTYPHRGYSSVLKKVFPFFRDMLIVIGNAENESREYYPDNLYDGSGLNQYSLKNPIPSRLQNP